MDNTSTHSPNSSLSALRGAVGGVFGATDAVGCWDRLVWLWRILGALDGLMAVLWAIVDRLRAGDGLLDGGCPAGAAALGERPGLAGLRLVRVRAVSGRRVLAVASVGRVRRGAQVALGAAGAGFGWDFAGFGRSKPAVFGTWVGLVAELRSIRSGRIMDWSQSIDNARSRAFPPFALRMEVFASFSKKKRFASTKSHRARWIPMPPKSGSQ